MINIQDGYVVIFDIVKEEWVNKNWGQFSGTISEPKYKYKVLTCLEYPQTFQVDYSEPPSLDQPTTIKTLRWIFGDNWDLIASFHIELPLFCELSKNLKILATGDELNEIFKTIMERKKIEYKSIVTQYQKDLYRVGGDKYLEARKIIEK